MKVHTLEATQGVPYALMGRYVALSDAPKSALTPDGATNDTNYAQLDPKTQQPVENGARNIWVTYTSLTGALNASYMAEQMANFGIVVGIALLLSGFGFVDPGPRRRPREPVGVREEAGGREDAGP